MIDTLSEGDASQERARAIATISGSLRTEARVRMLLALREGPKRPSQILKLSKESPSTIYRAIDQFILAKVVKKEGDGDKVVWSLTSLGVELVDSMQHLVDGKPMEPRRGAEGRRIRYAKVIVPSGIFAFAAVRAVLSSQPTWILGGLILALLALLILGLVHRG
jgi:DNA-binding HxlR family transcriptional regulator